MNTSFILVVILTIVRLWIATQLFLTARKSKLVNLYWLAGLFVLAIIYSLFLPVSNSPLEKYWFYRPAFHLPFMASQFCLVMFVHITFYRGRKSPINFFLGLTTLAFLVNIYALFINDLNLAGMMTAISLVNWTWHLLVARSAYATIAADPGVENWVKARYQLMIVYVISIILGSIGGIVIANTNLALAAPSALAPVSAILALIGIILQFLVWVMPEPFRLWLNRSQITHPVEQSGSMLNVLVEALMIDTGLMSIPCFYAIRTTVGKLISSEDSSAIQAQLNNMTYNEWEQVIQHPELRRILSNSSADSGAINKAIQNARLALVEKQSLITLTS